MEPSQPQSNGVSGYAKPTAEAMELQVGDTVQILDGTFRAQIAEVVGLAYNSTDPKPVSYSVQWDEKGTKWSVSCNRDQLLFLAGVRDTKIKDDESFNGTALLKPVKSLVEEFASFVERRKPMEPKKTTCDTCNQPLPTETPHRSNPKAESEPVVEQASWLEDLQLKAQFAMQYLRDNTPKPLAWMFKSLGWVAAGTVVVAVAIGAGYFLVRYAVWYALVALGKWLLEQIRRRLPFGMTMPIDNPSGSDGGYWWISIAAIFVVVMLSFVGKFAGWMWKMYRIKKAFKPGTRVVVEGKGEGTVVYPYWWNDGETLVHADWATGGGTTTNKARATAYKIGLDPDTMKCSWIDHSQIRLP